MNGMVKILFCVLILPACVILHAVDFIRDGQLVFSGIVLPDSPGPVEKYAADELAHHINLASGRILPILREKDVVRGRHCIYLGNCAGNKKLNGSGLDWNCGVIEITPEAIRISGKDSEKVSLHENSLGTLFAVYEFLEKLVGVRWLWPGPSGEVVPRRDNLKLPETRLEVKPCLSSSEWRMHPQRFSEGWHSKANCKRFFANQERWLLRHRFSRRNEKWRGHGFGKYYERYGKSHPEFFNLLPDGTRRINPYNWSRNPKFISMCVTNRELVKTIVENWKNGDHKLPVNLNENDTAGSCVCPDCLKADNSPIPDSDRLDKAKKLFAQGSRQWPYDALGSVTDRYCQFFLAVQREADKIDPNHLISGLIYANYCEPPSPHIKLNNRILLRFCPPLMYPFTEKNMADYKRQWAGWIKSGVKLQFRPNFTLSCQYFPVLYHEAYYELYTYCAKLGMEAVDMDSLTGHYAAQGLVNYIIASLNHDRTRPLAELENDFYSAFGTAGNAVRKYCEYLTEVTMRSGFEDPFKTAGNLNEGGDLRRGFFLVADRLFTPEVMKKCAELLDAAAKAPGLDSRSAERVKILQTGLENTRLSIAVQAEYRKFKAGGSIAPLAEALRKLDDYRASIESMNVLDMGNIRRCENRWRRKLPGKIFSQNKRP